MKRLTKVVFGLMLLIGCVSPLMATPAQAAIAINDNDPIPRSSPQCIYKDPDQGGRTVCHNTNFTGDLSGINLTNAELAGSTFQGVNLTRANLQKANLTYAAMANTTLASSDARLANFEHADLAGTTLSGSTLSNANFDHAILTQAKLQDVTFADAGQDPASSSRFIPTMSEHRPTSFRFANLAGADLSTSSATKDRSPPRGAIGVDFSHANMAHTNLTGTNLNVARLYAVDTTSLIGASLGGATYMPHQPVAAGDVRSCSVDTSGFVHCWGKNNRGELGDNTLIDSSSAVQVVGVGGAGTLRNITAISAAEHHACALDTSGRVYCWGGNNDGELGNLTARDSRSPVQVRGVGGGGALVNITAVAAGSHHSCALDRGGHVYCWGDNTFGQLGSNTSTSSRAPVQVADLGGVRTLDNIIAITAGRDHSCAIDRNGHAFCWGDNAFGQLGDNTKTGRAAPTSVVGVGGTGTLGNITAIAAGYVHTCALDRTGHAHCWGSNNPRNGTNASSESQSPVPILDAESSGQIDHVMAISSGSDHSCALNGSGHVYCWGEYRTTSVVQVGNGGNTRTLGNISSISSGGLSTCASDTSGQVYHWGAVSGSRLATKVLPVVSAMPNTPTAITVGAEHSCALNADGRVYCWGYNSRGQLGNNTVTSSATPVQVVGTAGTGALENITAISAGYRHSCALDVSKRVYCWGENNFGQLGDNTSNRRLSPVQVAGTTDTGTLENITAISAGFTQSCAVEATGRVYCWGNNEYGQLGNNTSLISITPVQVVGVAGVGTLNNIATITLGGEHACAIDVIDHIYCWGRNHHGQLGNATTNNSLSPVQVVGIEGSPALHNVKAITGGIRHSCALDRGGHVYCWGANSDGQVGNNTNTDVSSPVVVNRIGDTLDNVAAITSSGNQSWAIDSHGNAYRWGLDGDPRQRNQIDRRYFSPKHVFTAGPIGTQNGITTLAAGDVHVCALVPRSRIYCLGYNRCGQLGNNTIQFSASPVQVIKQPNSAKYLRLFD